MAFEIWGDIPDVSHWAFITTEVVEVFGGVTLVNHHRTIMKYKGYLSKEDLITAIKEHGSSRPYKVFRVDPAEITLDITVNVT